MDRLAAALLVAAATAGLAGPPAALPPPLRLASGLAALVLLACAGARVSGRSVPGQPRAVRIVAAAVCTFALWTVPAAIAGNAGLLTPSLLRPLALVAFLATRLLRPGARPGTAEGSAPRAERALLAAGATLAALSSGARSGPSDSRHPGRTPTTTRTTTCPRSPRGAPSATSGRSSSRSGTRAPPSIRSPPSSPPSPSSPPPTRRTSWPAGPSSRSPCSPSSPIVAVAGKLGVSPGGRGVAALAYASVPRAFPQLALSAGNDHAVAFLVCAAAVSALVLAERPTRGAALLAGASFGLLVGTKYTGLLYAAACVLLLLVAFAPPARPGGSRRAPLLFAIGGAALLTGGWTYLRNAVATGNPFFPAPVLGLPGWEAASRSLWRLRSESAIDPWAFLTSRPDRVGVLFPYLLLPAALLAPLAALLRRGRPWGNRARDAAVLALPVVFFAEFLFLMVDHRDVRYLLAALALSCVCLAVGIDALGRAAPALRLAVTAAFAGALLVRLLGRTGGATVAPSPPVVAVLLALAVFAALRTPRLPSPGSAGRLAASTLVVLGAFPAARWVPAYQEARLPAGSLARALDRVTSTRGATVAIVGTNQPYFLFGGALQNRAVYVRTPGPPPLSFFDWGRSASPGAETPRLSAWLENLARSGATYLAVRYDEPAPEHEWTDLVPGAIRLVARASDGDLFAVLPDQLARQRPPESIFDEGLPVALDGPAEGERLHGAIRARGWCQERGGGPIEPKVFRVDGRPLPVLSLARTPRPDVAAAIPAIGDGSAAGWEATLFAAGLAAGEHRLVVVFATPDGRCRRSPTRRFTFTP